MDVDIRRLPEVGRDAELVGVRAHPRERRLHRLFHDVPELAGQRERAGSLHPRRLDEQDVASGRGPGQPDRDARLARPLLGLLELEARHAEERRDQIGRHAHRLAAPLGPAPRDLPAHAGDLALEIPHAGLTRVPAGQQAQSLGRELDVHHRLETVLAGLLGHEVPLRDGDLLLLGVPGQRNDFHAIAQRRRHRVHHVRGRDEEHAR